MHCNPVSSYNPNTYRSPSFGAVIKVRAAIVNGNTIQWEKKLLQGTIDAAVSVMKDVSEKTLELRKKFAEAIQGYKVITPEQSKVAPSPKVVGVAYQYNSIGCRGQIFTGEEATEAEGYIKKYGPKKMESIMQKKYAGKEKFTIAIASQMEPVGKKFEFNITNTWHTT